MISLHGSRRSAEKGSTRRELLKVGALSLFGGAFNTASLQALEASSNHSAPPATAKRVVLLYLQGGPPTQDMFDMKPEAAVEVRGELTPVASSAPGIDVCELLPKTARWMHKAAVVRSVYHNGGCHKNLPMYTGFDVNLPDEEFRESDPPSMGSVCAWLEQQNGRTNRIPPYIFLPCALGWGEMRVKAGPHGGFLGHQYDPFSTICDARVANPPDEIWDPQPVLGEPRLNEIELRDGLTLDRLSDRRQILNRFDERLTHLDNSRRINEFNRQQRVAFDLLTSKEIRAAFDLSQEPDALRDSYGRTLFGSSTLLARRLVEAGARFINVSWDNYSKRFEVSKAAWDTHERNFPMLRKSLLPGFDQTYSAFIEDLDQRGLLDETLVVVMGEMGRTPRINAKGGRDHWTHCYSVLLAGGGVRGGTLFGASDRDAAYIQNHPVHIRDICATIYHCLGIDPHTLVYNRANRPLPIAQGGTALTAIL